VERMHYLSGRALHPIAINLAAVLQRTFDGQLDISFAGGVDCFNIARVLACNLKPVTICTDLLKPGGYGRLNQYLAEIRRTFQHTGARSLDAYIRATAGHDETETAGWINLERYADHVLLNGAYHRAAFPYAQAPKKGYLPPFDCIHAPCIAACPLEQEVPAYLRAVADGADAKAQQVILAQNPFPAVLGRVCHQPCVNACVRRFIDSPPAIRAVKRFAADRSREVAITAPVPSDRLRVAIIGAGPAGLSAAYFLAQRGARVEIFEKRADAGGMAAVIPAFRLDAGSLKLDIDRIRRLGVRLHFDTPVTPDRFEALRRDFDCLFIATGAQNSVRMEISGETGVGVHDHLHFLRRVHSGDIPELGRNAVVIGGGNAAIDVARTARRLVGDEGTVTLLYRRRRCDMPAEPAEVRAAELEGVRIRELTMPERIITLQGQVTGLFCHQLTPGPIDPSGRPAPMRTKEPPFRLEADSIIAAIGQKADLDFFPEKRLSVDPGSGETQLKRVFAGGDIVRGAGTLVEAVADGRRSAENIIKWSINNTRKKNRPQPAIVRPADHLRRLAQRCFSPLDAEQATDTFADFDLTEQTLDATVARAEAARCLSCDRYCAICTTVCPNRANVAYRVTPREIPIQQLKAEQGRIVIEQRGSRFLQQEQQIVHLVDLCNECGNCATFCPAGGRPWNDKPRFCLEQAAFERADNAYRLEGRILSYKYAGSFAVMTLFGETLRYETPVLGVTFDVGTMTVRSAVFKNHSVDTDDLETAMTMAILLTALQDHPVFSSGSTPETS
jgi:putative selenate reductase